MRLCSKEHLLFQVLVDTWLVGHCSGKQAWFPFRRSSGASTSIQSSSLHRFALLPSSVKLRHYVGPDGSGRRYALLCLVS